MAALVSACAAVVATPPQVEVASVELRGLGLLDHVLGVGLCVTNPNRTELAFERVTVAVDAAGAPLAEGVSDTPVRLPPLASARVSFKVVATARNLGPQLLGVARTGGVDYRLRGGVTLSGTPGLTLPFSRSGRFSLLTAGQEALADVASPAAGRREMPF